LRLAGTETSPNEHPTYHQDLTQFVRAAGLEKAVHFLGELDEPAILSEYSSCSALVLSSLLETASMAIMQAMAVGKAVVSTNVGGAPYLVEHGQTGLLVPSDDVDTLADALYEVLSNQTKLSAMGCRAKILARQRFHAQAVAARTRDVYYQILGHSSPPATRLNGSEHHDK
jgi:glycosyltransferase involved in cell wall biosynthesis